LSEPLQLSWTAGDWAAITNGHKVYFTTDANGGTLANSSFPRPGTADSRYRGTQTGTTYSLASLYPNFTLVSGTTYYWCVDEVNTVTGITCKGPLWQFTPADYITVEDFEDYNSTADINANWVMNYAIPSCYLASFDTITSVLATSGQLSFAVDGTGKHGRFYYNAKPFSEMKRNYPGGTVFTGNSVLAVQPAALRVDYIGATTNGVDEIYNRMYVAIEDTAGNVGVYDNPDGNAALATRWTQWYSSLNTIKTAGYPNVVNLGAVSNFYLGFGLRCLPGNDQGIGGDGNVMFDNIRLYASTCNPAFAPAADLDGDCDVDINDLLIFSNDWLKKAELRTFPTITAPRAPVLWYKFNETSGTAVTDYGTADANDYTGTVANLARNGWNTTGGRDANHLGCVYLPSGGNSYISCPTSALSFMGDANHATDGGGITFSTWINADLTAFGGWIYGFIVVKDVNGNDATEIACPHHYNASGADWEKYPWAGWSKNEPNHGFGLGPGTIGDNYGGRWNHWAFVKTPHTVSWYCNGSLIGHEADTDANNGDPNISGPLFPLPVSAFTIGVGGWGGNWAGRINDFQVYDQALSAEEIAYLATDGTGQLVLPLVSRSNFYLDGGTANDANQIVNFEDMSVMGDQWHQIKLWP
jgi:hypothetical protein